MHSWYCRWRLGCRTGPRTPGWCGTIRRWARPSPAGTRSGRWCTLWGGHQGQVDGWVSGSGQGVLIRIGGVPCDARRAGTPSFLLALVFGRQGSATGSAGRARTLARRTVRPPAVPCQSQEDLTRKDARSPQTPLKSARIPKAPLKSPLIQLSPGVTSPASKQLQLHPLLTPSHQTPGSPTAVQGDGGAAGSGTAGHTAAAPASPTNLGQYPLGTSQAAPAQPHSHAQARAVPLVPLLLLPPLEAATGQQRPLGLQSSAQPTAASNTRVPLSW